MRFVKIRRVGNSNVISLPADLAALGYTAGSQVMIEELETGELVLRNASLIRNLVRETGQSTIADNRVALDILAAHDRTGGRARSQGRP